MKSLFANPIQVKARTPSSFYANVMDEVAKGNDLYMPPFVAFTGEICQYLVSGKAMYEYRLVEAVDLDDLDSKLQGLTALGFDFMFFTVLWNGVYLQWMQRMTSDDEPILQNAFTAWTAEEVLRREG